MIRYFIHTEIDKQKWDQAVSVFTDLVSARSWWLDIVSPGWDAMIADDYQALMPLTWRKKAGFLYLYQPSFTQQLGVFGMKDPSNILAQIPEKFRLVEINLNEGNEGAGSPRINHILSLRSSGEDLFHGFSENTKRNIRKALEVPHTFTEHVSLEEMMELYRRNQGAKHVQMKKGEDKILEQLVGECLRRKCGILCAIRDDEKKLLASAFFAWTGKRVTFVFSATDLDQKIRWMSLLIHYCIAHDAGKDRIFDFEGGNDPALARFYKGFGAKEVVYLPYRKNTLPFWIKWMK